MPRSYSIRHTRAYRCEECGALFYSNKPAATCSNKCRQARHRARKAAMRNALELQSTIWDAIAEAKRENGGAE